MIRTVLVDRQASRKPGRSLFFALLAPFILSLPMPGQTGSPPQLAETQAPAYDVVSVKPHQAGDGNQSQGPTRDGYMAKNVMVVLLIRDAYNLTKLDQISGLPGWAADARFDLEAKMDEDTASAFAKLPHDRQWQQRQLMLQAALADRFKLRVHRETSLRPVYALVVAKGGSKLKPSEGSEGWWSWSGPAIVVHAEPVSMLAMCLSKLPEIDRIVIDKTSLTGDYDVDLKWTRDDEPAQSDAAPAIFTAIEEQLGLKLEPARGPVDVIVVDHIDRPTEN
jgi:uncharacterized protein (TIGR03435 family)